MVSGQQPSVPAPVNFPGEGTVVLWPGHLEMNYKHSEDNGSQLVAEYLKDCVLP